MGDGHAPLLRKVLELYVAAFLRDLYPFISLKEPNNFLALHSVYLYTLQHSVNIGLLVLALS